MVLVCQVHSPEITCFSTHHIIACLHYEMVPLVEISHVAKVSQ